MSRLEVKTETHQQLLGSMVALVDQNEAVERVVAALPRPMLDQDLSVLFYELTTIRAEGLSVVDEDVRMFGIAKEGLMARQFMLGVVQTAESLPIFHEVIGRNIAETKTLLPTLKTAL